MKPFNILMITQEDPFYLRLFFEEFFKSYTSLAEIKGVVIAPTMGKKSFKKLLRQMYDFYGPVDFARMGFRYVGYRAFDRLSRRVPLRRFYSLSRVCAHYNVPVINRGNINSDDFLDEIGKMDLDLIISVAAPQIFKEKLISIPRKGCINIHNSRLPKYRGMLPNFWQMFNGEKEVWTTVHRINAGIDDGEILLQRPTPISAGETLDSLIRKTKRSGATLMCEAVNGMKNDTLKPRPNSREEATYFSFPTKKDVENFRNKGYRLL